MLGEIRRRVVIADDDPADLELISIDLGLQGHDVVATCSSGEEAVAACSEHHPDVLVVDQRMPPGIDGLEVCRRVHAAAPGITVVLFTNFDEQEIVDEARQVRAIFVLKGDLRALRASLTLV
jgi:CheY-like chemotaxis protein